MTLSFIFMVFDNKEGTGIFLFSLIKFSWSFLLYSFIFSLILSLLKTLVFNFKLGNIILFDLFKFENEFSLSKNR